MWGRANMAAVTLLLLLGWICIFAEADGARVAGPKSQSSSRCGLELDLPADEPQQQHQQQRRGGLQATMLERATAWLWAQRDKDAGWGNDTHQVLLALRLANLSREENAPPPASLDMLLSTKQMELEIVMHFWSCRHREVRQSSKRMSRYALALNAMCMDPRQFHGHDLIGTLQHHEPRTDYEFALAALAACNAQAHLRKRQMHRLLDIAHAPEEHDIETVSMGIMTLRCIVQDHRHRNLQHFVRKPSLSLAQRQRPDGSFGDLRTTALAMQALEEVENEPLDNWNRTAALAWLASGQGQDGSFDDDVQLTAEAVLGLANRGMASIRTLDCGQGLTDSPPPRIVIAATAGEPSLPANQRTGSTTSSILPTSSSLQSSSEPKPNPSTSIGSSTSKEPESTQSTSTTSVSQLVNVTYTLWVGSDVDEIYNLTISAPKNETFYEVMLLAARRSDKFQFSAYGWPNGHYVHTLAGYKEEPMSYHYWLLYRLGSPPEPTSPPGNQLVAPGGVDDLQISDGEHYLFWYKKL